MSRLGRNTGAWFGGAAAGGVGIAAGGFAVSQVQGLNVSGVVNDRETVVLSCSE
jgi:hypothetical protein